MRNNFFSLLILSFVSIIVGCKTENPWKTEDLIGPIAFDAMPIKLEPNMNYVRLDGLGIDENDFISAKMDSLEIFKNEKGELEIDNEKLPSPIGNLHIQLKQGFADIPLFKSEKISYSFGYSTDAAVQEIYIAGAVNGWNNKADQLTLTDGKWSKDFILSPGRYPYRLWINGIETLDTLSENQMPNGLGGINNFFDVGDINATAPMILSSSFTTDSIFLSIKPSATHVCVYFNNVLISTSTGNFENYAFKIPSNATELEKATIRVFADNGSKRGNDLRIPIKDGHVISAAADLTRQDWQSSVMYFMMVDRFNDGDTTNNRPTLSPEIMPLANNLGGDIQGITQKIKDGYFQDLGVNTLWISPISTNAEGAWGLWDKGVRSTFSAYHGYWPTSLTTVDDRFGSEAAFNELVATAHANNMNVILDYVAHHVHQDHPLYKAHPEWTTSLYLEDGRMNTELWDEQRLTTWFDTFLPTWDFSKPEVVEALTDTAMYWVNNSQIDGFRHDATKHIPVEFWKALTKKIRSKSDRKVFQIGETYGSPELISSYIANDQLDAQFDFNLYDAIVDAFAKPNTGFQNLNRVLNESLTTYGSHNRMGNITGNQDRARFISYADGSIDFSEDAKLAGWTRNIQNANDTGYYRLGALQAFLMTAPGIPCVYYGDEIGMPGGNDPDNRRMMKFENLNEQEISLKQLSSDLIHLRKNSMALMYGELIPVAATDNTFVFIRKYFSEEVIVVFYKNQKQNMQLDLPFALTDGTYKGLFENDSARISGNSLKIEMKNENSKRYAFEVFHK